MVSLEIENGLVTLRYLPPYAADDERRYLDALHVIGQRREIYALMTIFGGGGKLSQPAEREQALWFKATRVRVQQYCRAVAIVRPGATEQMAVTFRKLWSMPIVVTEDEGAARAFVALHMAGP